jgi:hypothetical protein
MVAVSADSRAGSMVERSAANLAALKGGRKAAMKAEQTVANSVDWKVVRWAADWVAKRVEPRVGRMAALTAAWKVESSVVSKELR